MRHIDQVILATGYRAQIGQIPLLANGNILPDLAIHNGYPVLRETFETNIPGLFITSFLATQFLEVHCRCPCFRADYW